ncbi:hypothetical protein AeRB84_007395, partial [Aphanomyces euteiches]
MQKQDKHERVIAYTSQALDATQRRWINKKDGTSEIECFGLVWATTKFRPYIDKRHFTIYTDHGALVWLFKVGSKSGNSKLARWIIQLQALDFTVIHRPGTAMGCADGLSRLPISAITRSAAARQQTVIPDLADSPTQALPSMAETTPDPELPPYNDDSYELPTSLLAGAQADDPFIIAMKAYIQDSALPADPSLLTLVTRTHDQYALQGILLCRRVILKTPIRNPEIHLVPVIPLGWTRRHVRSIEYVVWRTGTAGDRTYTSTAEFSSAAELRKDLAPGAKADSKACRSTSYGDPLIFSSSTLSGLSRSPHARTVT